MSAYAKWMFLDTDYNVTYNGLLGPKYNIVNSWEILSCSKKKIKEILIALISLENSVKSQCHSLENLNPTV